ncbi:phage tail assembly chaperone [Pseudomonas lurida]|uniref:phage tail assembly chaperone n=1 Tax=Pseudomonas lurida TaxID=244566 RepID=UPI001F2837D0|nr:phage tail assembly chaperone [Pseudomonas lurida]MCF5025126.1 phage tail protein [Pseudomonas lurida]MCF5308303.1 phage tail protein [Pseudomonas lurida]MCF5327572.1 phage tail protein [Pseudomonas lurida]
MIFYSKTTRGFYNSEINVFIPEDRVQITKAEHAALLAGEAGGKLIVADENGVPYLAERLPATADDLAAAERKWRDGELSSVMWLRERHRDQQEIGGDTTLSAAQFAELLLYMQALRDWPQSANFPDIEQRPLVPAWIAEQTQ